MEFNFSPLQYMYVVCVCVCVCVYVYTYTKYATYLGIHYLFNFVICAGEVDCSKCASPLITMKRGPLCRMW